VTIRATGTAQVVEPLVPASAPATPELRTIWGVVLGGSLSGDVIIVSPEAMAIVKAGKLVRALLIAGMETVRRALAAGDGRTIRLEYGVYSTTPW